MLFFKFSRIKLTRNFQKKGIIDVLLLEMIMLE